jgi:hypothetical protein
LVLCLTIIVTSAQARTRMKTPPEETSGHWHYLYVDGKKCWHGPGGHVATSHDWRVTNRHPWSISRRSPAKVPVREGPPSKALVPIHAKPWQMITRLNAGVGSDAAANWPAISEAASNRHGCQQAEPCYPHRTHVHGFARCNRPYHWAAGPNKYRITSVAA